MGLRGLAGLDSDLESIVLGVPATDFTFSFKQAERQDGELDLSIPDAGDSIWEELREMYRDFVNAYREAAEKLKEGVLDAVFPPGCFPPGLPYVPEVRAGP